jgi:glycosyltransferase involved in cell wall biosynthesis
MTILNLMLGSGRGGLEQAAFDYAEALAHVRIPSLSLLSPGAWVEAPFTAAGLAHETLPNIARWDPRAILRLRQLAREHKARAIICHGNRAISLALFALKGRVPIIAVAHNYSTRRFSRVDACFAITQHLATHLRKGDAKQISLMPNMVRIPASVQRPAFQTPPVIGTLGRFQHKKGFDVLLDALAILAQRGIAYAARIGGDGAEQEALIKRAEAYGILDRVTFTGWVKDKDVFFEQLDLFVLPSRQEAFGLTLIEAMAHSVPVVTTDAHGPREIAHHGKDALVIPHSDPEAMADAIATLLSNPATASRLGAAGRALVEREYTLEAMGQRLQTALQPYMSQV